MTKTTDLEKLPKREGIKDHLSDRWGSYKSPRYRGVCIYKRIEWVLQKFVNKHFNDAYSYYCTLVPQQFRSEFLDIMHSRYKWWGYFIIDDNGIIRSEPKKSKRVTFRSIDYKREWVCDKRFKPVGLLPSGFMHYRSYCIDGHYNKISGYTLEFSSRNDPRYQQLQQEKMSLMRKLERQIKIDNKDNFIITKRNLNDEI